jgi:hypothetical protein
MAKHPPLTEPVTRKSMALPDTIWAAIDDIRRSWPGAVPSEVDVVRTLLREAIGARAANEAAVALPATVPAKAPAKRKAPK